MENQKINRSVIDTKVTVRLFYIHRSKTPLQALSKRGNNGPSGSNADRERRLRLTTRWQAQNGDPGADDKNPKTNMRHRFSVEKDQSRCADMEISPYGDRLAFGAKNCERAHLLWQVTTEKRMAAWKQAAPESNLVTDSFPVS